MPKRKKRSRSRKSKRVVVLTVPKGTRVKVKRKKGNRNPLVVQTGRTRVGVGFDMSRKGFAKWVPRVKVRQLPDKNESNGNKGW